MFKVGDRVRWRAPLDADYSYGTIIAIKRGFATVMETGYYQGVITEVHIKYMEKLKRGGKSFGSSKKYNKRSAP